MATFIFNDRSIDCTKETSLFDLAEKLGTALPSSCKKQGKCHECLLEINEGIDLLSSKTDVEKQLPPKYRLACQSYIIEEGEVKVQSLKRGFIRIEDKGVGVIDRGIIEANVCRKGNAVLLGGEMITETTEALLGLAIDIGTTTVVVRLVDLEDGKIKAVASFENPQRYAGSNVMSRIVYDTEHGKKQLKRVFTAHLSSTIYSICEKPANIFEVVIGGNTTMRDLFFGLNVYSIGQMPYKSITETEVDSGLKETTTLRRSGKRMGLPIHPKANVLGLPIIGGHVGADTVAGLLAIELLEEDKVIIFMDIGTNTEIVIGNKHSALAASSPSGPAFEGGGIVYGMPALNGAIESVHINEKEEVIIKTIGNEAAVGVCGSGLIDALGELCRTEKINLVGRFEYDEDHFVLDKKNNVFINENDINLLAQTKAANVAALQILTKNYGVSFDEIDTFYLAGGFGEHIDLEACIRIGLLPNIDLAKFKRIGNASIEGLTVALLSKSKREEMESFVLNIKQINLESDPMFFDYFVDGCLFQEII